MTHAPTPGLPWSDAHLPPPPHPDVDGLPVLPGYPNDETGHVPEALATPWIDEAVTPVAPGPVSSVDEVMHGLRL
jgi:hypothetical protein